MPLAPSSKRPCCVINCIWLLMYIAAKMEYLRDKMPIREGNCLEFLSSLRDSVPLSGELTLAPWAVVCRPCGAWGLLGVLFPISGIQKLLSAVVISVTSFLQ